MIWEVFVTSEAHPSPHDYGWQSVGRVTDETGPVIWLDVSHMGRVTGVKFVQTAAESAEGQTLS